MADVFNVQIFFIVLRETLEAVIVVSVLFAFVKQSVGKNHPALYKSLLKQIWIGAILGVVICLIIGCSFIGVFYSLGHDIWSSSEDLWEGIFCLIATVLISIMGVAMLRINKMQAKWRVKIAKSLLEPPATKKERLKISYLLKKYCMFILPFITTLREGLEAVVFVGGVGIGTPAKSFPLPVICGLIAGITVGTLLYYGGSEVSLQIFLCISTGILYLIAAGLFSRSIWDFEQNLYVHQSGGDAAEQGSGPGSYDISKTVWHVNCCNPETDNGWDVFNSLLGWQNTATYGSVIGYNVYWLALIVTLLLMLFEEKHGHLPFLKGVTLRQLNPMYHIKNKKKNELTTAEQADLFKKVDLKLKDMAGEMETENKNAEISEATEASKRLSHELDDLPTPAVATK